MTSIVLGGYISVLNNHVINVVIPKMMSGLGTDVVTIRWVVTTYMLANAVVIPLVGWLARRLGAREVYILGLLLFTSSAVVCGMAGSVAVLVVFRALQGIGGGLIMPVTMLLMLDLYPPEKRGLGTAIWGMGASCGSLTGIPLGGFLAEHLSWRAAFYANLPPGLVALLIAVFVMHPSPRERHVPFDWWGFLTLGTALVALLLAVSNGQRQGWDASPIVALFLLCGAAFVAFLLIEPRVATPLVDLGTFRSPQYAMAIVLSLIAGAMFSGGPFLVSLFLQRLYDFSVQQAALIMFPSSAFLVLCTPVAGWLSDRLDARLLMVVGYLSYATFAAIMTFADLRFSALAILILYFGRGIGLGLSYPVIYPIGISGLPAARGKAATTLLNLCITLGGALSVSILGALLEQRQLIRQALLAETQHLAALGTQRALAALQALAVQLGGALPPALHARVLLARLIDREALLLAFNDCFGFFVVICLGAAGLSLFFRRARPPA
ncbi:MAG: MFS transporter [Candidatus Tectimicrobiota bacterium]|nr:MAG: MFS transporter [Candidatus Tectomicrobia bacterium]